MNHRRWHGLLLVALAAVMVAGCGGRQTLSNLGPEELFQKGKQQYDRKKYVAAVESFQSIVYNFPGNTIVDTAQYYLALSYYANKEYELAGVEFNRLLVNYPASPYAAQSQFMKAVCSFEATPGSPGLDQTELEAAIKEFEDFLVDRPESELAADAKKYLNVARTRMARKYYKCGVVYSNVAASEAAKIYYQKVADDYTDTEFAPLATFRLAQEESVLKQYDQAKSKFQNFVQVFPEHKLAAKAREMAIVCAFKGAEWSLKKGDTAAAREKLLQFRQEFPQDKRTAKVNEWLRRIGEQASSDTTGVQKGS